MTTTIDRAEINRRNASKSTGPRTPEGKARSRFNAVKHGCRASLPIIPGEAPEVYQARLDAWLGKFAPRDAVEHYLVERAVHVSWQLDRADRAEVARLADEIASRAEGLAEEAGKLGSELFRTPADRAGDDGLGATMVSRPHDRSHPEHPARLVAALESTAAGCDWLRAQWAELGRWLDEGRMWRAYDRLRAIRMLGRQPLDVVSDDRLMSIYLACHRMAPTGPDVFAEPLGDLQRPEWKAQHDRLSRQFAAMRANGTPRDAAAGVAALRAIVTAAMARLEALHEVRAAAEAAGTADIAARLSNDGQETVGWLHKHQLTCSRSLFRTFDELRKVRRDFGDDLPSDEPAAEPMVTGPGVEEATASESSDPQARRSCPICPGGRGSSRAAREGSAGASPSPGPDRISELVYEAARAAEAPESSREEPIEPSDLSPTDPEPIGFEPVADREAPTVTNEASTPAGEGQVATNEASSPAPTGGSASVRPGPAGPALGPIEDRPGPQADGPAAGRPTEAEPDDRA